MPRSIKLKTEDRRLPARGGSASGGKTQKLLVFVKFPEVGKVKTRLAESIGGEQATEIYKKLVEDTIQHVKCLTDSVEIVIAYDPPEREEDFRQWLGDSFFYLSQEGSGLGERLFNASAWAFSQGAGKTVVIGTDCPTLDSETMTQAFKNLSVSDIVLGPSKDGGYYLVGLNSLKTLSIFKNISWSTPKVLKQTLKNAENLNLSHNLLDTKSDVDTIKDLVKLDTK